MVWVRRTRATLLVGLLIAIAVLAWLAAHPATYSGQLGRIITDNLLHRSGAALTFETMQGNPLRNLTFYRVAITRPSDDGGFVYLTADSLSIDYDLRSFFSPEPHLRSVILGPSQLLVRRPNGGAAPPAESGSSAGWNSSVRVDFARIDALDLSVTSASGEVLEELQDLRWVGSLRTDIDQSVRVHTARLAAEWPSRSLRARRISFDATARGRRLQLEDVSAEFDSTRAEFDMELTRGVEGGVESFHLEGTTDSFLLNEVLTILGKDPGPRLRLEGAATLDYADGDLELQGRAHGWLETFPVAAEEFQASIDSAGIRFDNIRGSFLSAHGDLRGSLDFDSSRLQLRGDFTDADLSEPWTGPGHDWPSSRVRGRVAMGLVVSGPLQLDLDLSNLSGEALGLPLSSGATVLHYDEGNGLEVVTADAQVLDSRFHATGTVDAQDRVELAVTARAADSRRWTEQLSLPLSVEGLQAAGRLSGTVDSLALRVGGSADHLVSSGFEGRGNLFVLELPRFENIESANGQLRSQTTSLRGVQTGALRADFRRRGTRLDLDEMSLSSADTTLRWKGAVEWGGEVPTLEVDSLEIVTGSQRSWLEEPARLDLFDDGVRTDGLRLRSEVGRLSFEGTARRNSTIAMRVSVDGAHLSALQRLGLAALPARGDFDATASLSGTLDDLRGEVELTVRDAVVADRQVDTGHMLVTLDGPSVTVQDFTADGPIGMLGVRGGIHSATSGWPRQVLSDPASLTELWHACELDLSVHSDSLAVATLADPLAERLRYGLVSMDLEVDGTPIRTRVVGDLKAENIESSALIVPQLRVHLASDERGVRVESGSLSVQGQWLLVAGDLPLDLSLATAPQWNASEGLRLRIWSDGEVPLAPFEEFWPLGRNLAGKAEFEFLAQGDPANPDLSGFLRVRDGSLGLTGWSERLREAELDARFVDHRLVIDRLEGREGAKGRVSATGEVGFVGLLPDDVWADIRVDRVLLVSVPFLRAVGTSNDLKLRLVRPSPDAPRAPHLTGTVLVDKAIYTGEFAATSAGGEGLFGPNLTPQWTADIAIRAREQVRISNQSAELRVEGDVDLIRDTAGLRFRGTAEIPRGRVPLFNNDFSIVSGSLDFSRRPVEPEVDITAETEVPIYDPGENGGRQLERITVHLTGTFAKPTVEFTSENGLDENSILRLLAGFGGPAGTTTVSSGVSDLGVRAGLNFLERALAQRVGGVDTIDIETEETAVTQMQSTRIAVGKYLSESLYLRLSQGLSITERDLFLEYQISRRMLFTSELRRRLRENGAENQFNVDVKFRVKY